MKYLTVKEAADVARLHWQTIGDALRDGDLHGIHRGKGSSWRVEEGCLDAWLAGRPCEHQALEVAA